MADSGETGSAVWSQPSVRGNRDEPAGEKVGERTPVPCASPPLGTLEGTMRSFDEQLKREAQMMGRPCEYVNGWECVFTGGDGQERTLRVMVYNVGVHEVAGHVLHESRYVAWDDTDHLTGGVVNA